MSLYERLKKIQLINYYFLGEQNNSWSQTVRNPFTGIKLALGVPNINAHSILDLRIGYIPIEYIPLLPLPSGVKKTTGKPWVRWMIGRWVIFELRKSHKVDACYLNGFLTFSFNLVNKYFPWISLNIRPIKNWMFNFGIFWEGTSAKDAPVAEIGLKCRITSYKKATKFNPDCVVDGFFEGHI